MRNFCSGRFVPDFGSGLSQVGGASRGARGRRRARRPTEVFFSLSHSDASFESVVSRCESRGLWFRSESSNVVFARVFFLLLHNALRQCFESETGNSRDSRYSYSSVKHDPGREARLPVRGVDAREPRVERASGVLDDDDDDTSQNSVELCARECVGDDRLCFVTIDGLVWTSRHGDRERDAFALSLSLSRDGTQIGYIRGTTEIRRSRTKHTRWRTRASDERDAYLRPTLREWSLTSLEAA